MTASDRTIARKLKKASGGVLKVTEDHHGMKHVTAHQMDGQVYDVAADRHLTQNTVDRVMRRDKSRGRPPKRPVRNSGEYPKEIDHELSEIARHQYYTGVIKRRTFGSNRRFSERYAMAFGGA